MKIGGKYKLLGIGAREWEKCATELHIDFAFLRERILNLASALPETARRVGAEIQAQGIAHDVIGRLSDTIGERARRCEEAMVKDVGAS
jgi:hypothetical protein